MGFDTHAYVKKVKAVGFTEDQAEAQTQVIAELIDSHPATKRDLKQLEVALKRDLKELETALIRDIQEVELRLRHDLTFRPGGMLAAGIAAVAASAKLF